MHCVRGRIRGRGLGVRHSTYPLLDYKDEFDDGEIVRIQNFDSVVFCFGPRQEWPVRLLIPIVGTDQKDVLHVT